MTSLVAAELAKLRTVRTTWVVTAIGWLTIAMGGAFLVFEDQITGVFTGSDSDVAALVDQIGGSSAIVLVVALLLMTTEFRHGTIGRTLQLTPSRTRVLVGKLVVGVCYALAFVVTGLMVVAALLLLAVLTGDATAAPGSEAFTAMWQGAVALSLTALLGVAVGSLLRSQVVAITASLIWIFVAEQLVNALLPEVGRWLPFQALNSIFVSEAMRGEAPLATAPLSAPVALAVFVGWVVAAAVPAVILMRVRDV